LPSVNYLAYKNALKQAWKDGKMSADESAMLDTLRKSLNISAEDHMNIEKEVRSELAADSNGANPILNGAMDPQMPGADNGFSNGAAGGSNEIKNLLTAGKNSYHKGNYEEAIDYCDQVLLLDPDNSEALFFRKRTLSKIEKVRGKGEGKNEVEEEMVPEMEDESVEEPAAVPEINNGEVSDVEPAAPEINSDSDVPSTPNNTPPPAPPPEGGGDPNCKSCGGSGQCHWCQGSGKCYWCKGTGNCDKCKGEGKIDGEECKSCKGAGKCHSCMGEGTCYWCKGSGKCSKCSM
jgi:hypothetical protein